MPVDTSPGLDRLVLSAGTLQRVPLLDRLEPAKDAGFAGVSVFAADLEALESRGVTAREVAKRVAGVGLFVHEVEIVGNWLPGAPTKNNPDWLTALLRRSTGERLIGMAEAIGARGITVGELQGVACPLDKAVEAFARLCEAAEQAGLHVALEFVPTGSIAALAAAWEIVRTADRANGGLLVDSWHFFRGAPDLALLASLPPSAVKSVQIGDAPATPDEDLDREMTEKRLLPGDGALDLRGFIAALRTAGVTAPCAVEVFSAALSREPVGVIARRCAAAARNVLGERHNG